MDLWNDQHALTPAAAKTQSGGPPQMDLSFPAPNPHPLFSAPPGAQGMGDAALTGWIQAVQGLHDRLPPNDQETRTLLESVLRDLHTPEVTLAFGGHFNAGKSTLINGLLGRDILPVDDVVETGAMCIVRAGTSDRAWLHHKDGTRELPCVSADIRAAISLLTAEGARRADLQEVDHLEVTLANVPLPTGARWIDTPGTDDKLEMTACALRAVRQSDILIWVLNAQQILSQGEMEFVAQCVEERGAASVVFMLNAFLPDDTPDQWQTFLESRAERLTQKVRDHAELMGYTPDVPPFVLATSGRALCGARSAHSLGVQTDYGRAGLTTLLTFLHNRENARVQRSRLYAGGRRLLARCAQVETRVTAAQAEQERKRAEAQAERERAQMQERKRQEIRERRTEYEKRARETAHAQADQCALQIYACGEQLAAQVTPAALRRDNWYQIQLDAALQTTLTQWLRSVCQSASDLLTSCGQAALTPEQRAQIQHSLILPPSIILAGMHGSTATSPPVTDTVTEADVTALQGDIRAAARRAVQVFGVQVDPFAQLLQSFGMDDAARSLLATVPASPPTPPPAAPNNAFAADRAMIQAMRPLGEQALQLALRPL